MSGWIGTLVELVLAVVRGLFGSTTPREHTITHAKQEVPIDDGQTDAERLRDLGL